MPTKVSNVGIKKQTKYKRRKTPKKKNIFKTVVFAFITVLLSTLVLSGLSLYKFLNAPFSSANVQADSVKKDGIWGKEDLNLMVIRVDDKHSKNSAINSFYLANFDSANRRYTFYKFPLEETLTYVDDTEGNLRDILKYAKNNDKDVDFVLNTFFKQFAVKADGYIVLDNSDYGAFGELIGTDIPYDDLAGVLRIKNTFKIPALINTFREKVETNLTLSDLFGILNFIKNTSENSSSIKEVTKYGILDHDVWDQVWKEKLSYESIKKEYLKVLILNASSDPKIPGLAGWGSRIIENIGSTVLDTENSFEEFTETAIIATNKDSKTVQELATIFNIPYIIDVNELDQNKNFNPQIFRSDITLVITDYSK